MKQFHKMVMISAMVFAFTVSGCNRDTGPIGSLSRGLSAAMGIQPNVVLTLNFAAMRNSPPAQDLMKQYRSQMISFFEKSDFKHCDVPQIVDKLDSAAVIVFDNMNWVYSSVQGTFDMQKTVDCVEKNAKQKVPSRMVHGKKVYTLERALMWVASPNSIVVLGQSPKMRVRFGEATLKAEGDGGLLEKLLKGKDAIATGKIPKLSSHLLSFRVNQLPKPKGKVSPVALPIQLPMPTSVWGHLMIDEKVSVQLGATLESAEVAKDVKNSLSAVAVFLPGNFSDSLKITNKDKMVQAVFKHSTKELVELAKKAATEQMKKMKTNPFAKTGVKLIENNTRTNVRMVAPPARVPEQPVKKADPSDDDDAKAKAAPAKSKKTAKKDDDDE